ncbi:MAG: acyl-CoA desaturase [Deltaproteobacteria bacterium]|nr:acyl-CoA desaturase [Deltaproteobacteria bacterium]
MQVPEIVASPPRDRADLLKHIPFWGVHVAAVVGAVMVGWSWAAFAWLAGSYFVRMFAITGGYHRYFAHRTYKTGRVFQFILALLAMSSAQQGVLWWAAHHRNHHKHSDEPQDTHSPVQRGFWWSHVGWILSTQHANRHDHHDRIKDFARYPELRWLDRHDLVVAVAWGFVLYGLGGTTALFWGHFVSLVFAWHITFCINSLAHVWGSRRYQTSDASRNNPVLAILTLGEGWHNNHHHYQRTARQGFFWWEVDITFYVLKGLEKLRIVWDVEGVPAHIRANEHAPARERIEKLVGPAAITPPA